MSLEKATPSGFFFFYPGSRRNTLSRSVTFLPLQLNRTVMTLGDTGTHLVKAFAADLLIISATPLCVRAVHSHVQSKPSALWSQVLHGRFILSAFTDTKNRNVITGAIHCPLCSLPVSYVVRTFKVPIFVVSFIGRRGFDHLAPGRVSPDGVIQCHMILFFSYFRCSSVHLNGSRVFLRTFFFSFLEKYTFTRRKRNPFETNATDKNFAVTYQ